MGGVDSSTGKLVPVNIDHATGNLLTSAAAASATSTAINDGVTTSTKATIASLTNSNPIAVEIVDGAGSQITSFGGGTQYVDAATTATHPTGTMPVYDNAGTISKVSVGNGLPIQPATGSSFAVTGTFWQSTQPISAASLPLPSGASTAAKQPALGVAGTASSDVITIQGIASMTKLLVTPDSVALPANQSVNISQINSVTPLMGNGVTGTGSQRVTIASDNTAFAVNSTLSAETTKVIGTVNIASSQTIAVTNSGTFAVQADTEMAAAVAVGDGIATQTTAPVVSYPVLFSGGTTFDRVRGGQGDGAGATGLQDIVGRMYNGSTYDRVRGDTTNGVWVNVKSQAALPAGTNVIGHVITDSGSVTTATLSAETTKVIGTVNIAASQTVGLVAGSALVGKVGIDQTTVGSTNAVTPVPASNSGWSFSYQSALSSTKAQIKGTAGTFGGYINLFNPNTATTFIQVFNLASASVTVGSTTPDFVITLPGIASASGTGSDRNLEMTHGVAMGTGITVAATTTATGSTAPSNAVVATFLFK